jgi:hypothetical protein
MAYIRGIEDCKRVVKDMIDLTNDEIDALNDWLDDNPTKSDESYIQDRLDHGYYDLSRYQELVDIFDTMLENEINNMAEAMDGVYNV